MTDHNASYNQSFIFDNLAGYDSHPFIENLGKGEGKISNASAKTSLLALLSRKKVKMLNSKTNFVLLRTLGSWLLLSIVWSQTWVMIRLRKPWKSSKTKLIESRGKVRTHIITWIVSFSLMKQNCHPKHGSIQSQTTVIYLMKTTSMHIMSGKSLKWRRRVITMNSETCVLRIMGSTPSGISPLLDWLVMVHYK